MTAFIKQEAMEKAREIAIAYPRLRTRLDTNAAGYADAPDQTFEFGLRAILDGLTAMLASRRW